MGEYHALKIAESDSKPARLCSQSDATASSPVDFGTHPTDVLATIYHMLGISPDTIIYNHLNQPRELVKGKVITGLV